MPYFKLYIKCHTLNYAKKKEKKNIRSIFNGGIKSIGNKEKLKVTFPLDLLRVALSELEEMLVSNL